MPPRRRRCSRARWLALGWLAMAGCADGTRYAELAAQRAEWSDVRAARRPPGGLRDLRGALHVHTAASHDSDAAPHELVAAAHAAGIDFVAMTEHAGPGAFERTLAGVHGDVLFLPGLEIIKGCRGLANRCASLLAVGLREGFDPDALDWPAVVAEVRRQGALAIVAHPHGWRHWELPGLAGLEIYDVLDDALDRPARFAAFGWAIARHFDAHPDEVFLEILDRPNAHLARLDALLAERPWTAVAGNDAHQNVRLLGRQIDPYTRSLRHVTTHVWAAEPSRADVLEALARGRAYLAFELLADATGFAFVAEADGQTHLPGDTVAREAAPRLRVHAPLPGRILLLRDGEPVARCDCDELVVRAPGAGAYRTEVSLLQGERELPWILSNAIFVR